VNEGPTCYIGKLYWGAAKKACGIDQYGAPPLDGSKEDGQVGVLVLAPTIGPTCCNEKPYQGATKKACNADQYGAPPMDELKNGQTGAPVAVLARMPTAVVAAKGSAAPIAATMAPTTRSREAAAAT
jgi:hypothetical protein